MSSNNRQTKGGYVLQKVFITTHNGVEIPLDADFSILEYTESIEKQWIEGSIGFTDLIDFVSSNSIIGGEKLVIEYKVSSDSGTITKNFVVSRVSCSHGGKEISQRNANVLEFVCEQYMRSKNVSISRAYKNKSAGQIVKDLFSEIDPYETPLFVDPNIKSSHHVIIPNLEPFVAINFISSIARHSSDKTSRCCFFPGSNGYNFVSYAYMFKKKSLGVFGRNLQIIDNGQPEKRNSLLSIEPISTSPSLVENMFIGMIASRNISYDPLVKSYKVEDKDYISSFDDMEHLNEFPLLYRNFKEYADPRQFVNLISSNSIRKKSSYFKSNSEDTSHSNDIEDQIPYNRFALHAYSKYYKITIKADDCPSLHENSPRVFSVGEVIEVEQPNKTIEKDQDSKPSKYFNGKYLVSECKHIFTKDSYLIEAKICSDSNIEDHNRRIR